MVDEQPAVLRLDRRSARADPGRVPPRADMRWDQQARERPLAKIVRVAEGVPDLWPPSRLRPVEHQPAAVELHREERGVLVRRHRHGADTLDALEAVVGGRERHCRAIPPVGRVRDRPLAVLKAGQARVLASPLLEGILRVVGRQQRQVRDLPVVHAIGASGDAKLRHPLPALYAQEKHDLIAEVGDRRVEDPIVLERHIGGREERVRFFARERALQRHKPTLPIPVDGCTIT